MVHIKIMHQKHSDTFEDTTNPLSKNTEFINRLFIFAHLQTDPSDRSFINRILISFNRLFYPYFY